MDENSYIGLEAAKEIALNKAALTADTVTYKETSFEFDDGVALYKIEFFHDGKEYEFEIHAVSGDILKYEMELQYH